MRSYQKAWLAAHPERSVEWFKTMVAAGFDVHHVDGDHDNDHPANLVLLESTDHLRLHGLFGLIRLDVREISRKGGTNRWKGKTKKQISAHMKMMAMKAVFNRRRLKAEGKAEDRSAHCRAMAHKLWSQRKATHKARK